MKSLPVIALFLAFGLTDVTLATLNPQEMPQVKKKVGPVYPEIFRKAGIEGEVLIRAFVNEEGKVEKAEAVKASKPEFAEASITAIKQWEFVPATKDGKPVKAEVLVPLNFRLGDKSTKPASGELLKVQEEVVKIIKGDIPDGIKGFIEPEAYAVVGNKYESLSSLLFEKPKENPLIEGEKFKPNFSNMGTSVSEDAAVLVMKSSPGKGKRDRFDTIALMKTSEGVWRIHSWHMSK